MTQEDLQEMNDDRLLAEMNDLEDLVSEIGPVMPSFPCSYRKRLGMMASEATRRGLLTQAGAP